ncbi:MAG: prephenate dehydratase [Rhodocyclaceae bacterium]
MDPELARLREGIDRLDDELLDRISRRAALAKEIGALKDASAWRPEREAQVLARMAAGNPGPLDADTVRHLFREIMSACLALEQPLTIAYLGPRGTFSESATRKRFGAAPRLLDLPTIDEVFRAVESGNADCGVVPVENSSEGAVGRTLDLLLATPLRICGEVGLRVDQHLVGRSGSSAAAAKRLYSHAQSLAQCHEWLNRNLPNVARIPVASNAEAARMASGDPESCAIAGEAAAALYGLDILARNIEDDPDNTTRFLVLGRHEAGRSGNDKTSFACSAPNRPGAMYALLAPLAHNSVSMTKLESRPSGSGLWEYVFFIDIEGHMSEPAVAAALEGIRERASFLKVLGSYPREVF